LNFKAIVQYVQYTSVGVPVSPYKYSSSIGVLLFSVYLLIGKDSGILWV